MMSRYTETKSKSFSQNFVTNDVLLEPKINMGILTPALGYLGHYSEWKNWVLVPQITGKYIQKVIKSIHLQKSYSRRGYSSLKTT